MYKCNECGAVFDFLKVNKEVHNELEDGSFELFSCCPECGGDDVYTVHECQCGEYIPNCEKLCGNCQDKAMKQFEYFIRNEFTEVEREYIYDNWEG